MGGEEQGSGEGGVVRRLWNKCRYYYWLVFDQAPEDDLHSVDSCLCEDCGDERMWNYIADNWGEELANDWLDRTLHLREMQGTEAREL